MSGCRSLTNEEIQSTLKALDSPRNKCLFILGLRTGFRISEILSLRWKDVFQNGAPVNRIRVQKRNVKGKTKTREVVLHPEAKAAILELSKTIPSTFILEGSNVPLFLSRNGIWQSISRFAAHKILKEAYEAAGVTGHVATHTMRKTFAGNVHRALKHDLVATKEALGHSSILTTVKYLEVKRDAIDAAILAG